MALAKPKLLFLTKVERKPYLRRFWFWLFLGIIAGGAWFGVEEAVRRQLIDGTIYSIGVIAALLLVTLAAVNTLLNLIRYLIRKNETARFLDRGFQWIRGKDEYQTSWNRLESMRETNASGIYLGKRPLIQWGSHTLKMRDGKVFRFTPVHGDMRRFLRAVRPYVADVTGSRMGTSLREEQPVMITRGLTLFPGGLKAGNQEIPWAELDVRLQGNTLNVFRKNTKGDFRRVKGYDSRRIDNLSGFMEVVSSTIKNYQPQRFGIQTHGPLAQMLAKPGQKIDIRVAPRLLDNILYRSKLEFDFARELKDRRLKWLYESEALGRKKYWVDFYLPDLGVWIDVMKQPPDSRTEAILTDIHEYLWLERNQQRLFVYMPDSALYIGSQGAKPLSINEFWMKIYKP
jgi:hypothetical protein